MVLGNSSLVRRLIVLIGLAIIPLAGCTDQSIVVDPYEIAYDAAEFDGDRFASDWFDLIGRAVQQSPGFTQPIASRVYCYTGITLYESVVPGMPGKRSLVGQLRGLESLPKPEASKRYYWTFAANTAIAIYLRSAFANAPLGVRASIDSLEKFNSDEKRGILHLDRLDTHDPETAQLFAQEIEMMDRSISYGQRMGEAMVAYAKTDGGDGADQKLFPADYQVPVGDGKWIPTLPSYQPIPMLPTWGSNRTMLLNPTDPGSELDPGVIPPFSTDRNSEFYKQATDVYSMIRSVPQEKAVLVAYWADLPEVTSTNSGHLISIMNHMIRTGPYRLDFTAELYARVGIAMNESCIACWNQKYKSNIMRPISYIRQNIEASWNKPTSRDPLPTPASPEFISAEVMQSTAVIDILKSMFGKQIRFIDRTNNIRGLVNREYKNLDVMQEEIIESQRYSGTHYKFSIDAGQRMGKNLGTVVMSKLNFQQPNL